MSRAASCSMLLTRTSNTRSSANHYCDGYGGNLSVQSSGCTRALSSTVTSSLRVRQSPPSENKNLTRRTDILLTANPFTSLPPEGKPLVKLTDFGLSRKIDPEDPWLCTRCGSESYAAPELLVAAHSTADAEPPLPSLSRAPSDAHGSTHFASHTPPHALKQPRARTPGTYDGRETDAWALGVVLFALATRALPFDPPLMLDNAPPADIDAERARRRWVLRVVRGEWTWPVPAAGDEQQLQVQGEPRGVQLMRLEKVRDVVARLLVCDPRRRARVGALWDEPWMCTDEEAMVP